MPDYISLPPHVVRITSHIMALHMTAVEMNPRSHDADANPSTTTMTTTEMQQIIIE